jgi:hypothetical protein
MRKIFVGVTPAIVLAFALMLPASTLAATGWNTAKLKNNCDSSNWPTMVLTFKSRIIAKGTTTTDHLRIVVERQTRSFQNWSAGWMTGTAYTVDKVFTPNGSPHSLTNKASFNFPDDSSVYNRFRMTLSAIDDANGGAVQYSKVLSSVSCGGQ